MNNGWKKWRLNISEGNQKGKRKQTKQKGKRHFCFLSFLKKLFNASWSKDPFITFHFMGTMRFYSNKIKLLNVLSQEAWSKEL